jgi:hypothetical protein
MISFIGKNGFLRFNFSFVMFFGIPSQDLLLFKNHLLATKG